MMSVEKVGLSRVRARASNGKHAFYVDQAHSKKYFFWGGGIKGVAIGGVSGQNFDVF